MVVGIASVEARHLAMTLEAEGIASVEETPPRNDMP